MNWIVNPDIGQFSGLEHNCGKLTNCLGVKVCCSDACFLKIIPSCSVQDMCSAGFKQNPVP